MSACRITTAGERELAMKRRTEITIKTDRLLIFRQSNRHPALARCARCGTETPMLTVDEATTLSRLSARTIFRLVEAEQVHFTETPDGRLLICPDSLR
jgi:hypothetical protein